MTTKPCQAMSKFPLSWTSSQRKSGDTFWHAESRHIDPPYIIMNEKNSKKYKLLGVFIEKNLIFDSLCEAKTYCEKFEQSKPGLL
jgi:hypothetical protein